jgi:hypothetical protein
MRLSPHVDGDTLILCSFDESTNASGTQQLAHRTVARKDAHPLQIRAEGPSGRTQRMAAIMSEGSGFSTIFTFCHDMIPFPAIIQSINAIFLHASGDFTTMRIFFQPAMFQI